MKNKEIITRIAAIGFASALLLTGCGAKTAAKTGDKNQSDIVSEVIAPNSEEEALAAELIERNVTSSDKVTLGVITAAIPKLKEKYEFEKLDTLKLGSGGWVYISDKNGWFDKLLGDNNTSVAIVEGTVGNEVQLMERDELHLTNRMLYPYLLYKAQGGDVTAVELSEDPSPGIVTILVRKDSDYQKLEDLKGKTIASWKAGCQYVALIEQTIDLGWVEGTDWTYANVSNSDIKTALDAGEVDAISVHPFANINNEIISGNFREIANAKENGVYTNYGGASVTFSSTEFANSHVNILKAVLKLRQLVNAYIIQNPEETSQIIETITRDPAVNTAWYNDRSKETFYSASAPLSQLIDDTDNYQNWLIENTEEFTEEGRVDKQEFFNSNFFE
ncbi:MAG: ABC transporter substrate-binding protein [Lachnospiraceae bacterium]|nr:ABC transporter substrate-binding protein [Lachnospiraceae bacterium]